MTAPVFDAHDCICDHPEQAHDDGFGCTVRGCRCLAGWSFPATHSGTEGPGGIHSDTEFDAPGW